MIIESSQIPDINETNEEKIKNELSDKLISTITPIINKKIKSLRKELLNLDTECKQLDTKTSSYVNDLSHIVSEYKKEKFKNEVFSKLKSLIKTDKKSKNEILFLIDIFDRLSIKTINKYLKNIIPN